MHFSSIQYVPQVTSIRRAFLMWSVVAAGSVAVMALIVGAPLALKAGHPAWGQTIYRTFSYLCHQIPQRSFFVAEHQFAVCARCTGVYAGFTLATLVYPLARSLRHIETPPRKWLFIAAAPLAIDFIVSYFGIWANTHFSRFATGALLGAVGVFYVMPGLLDLSLREWHTKKEETVHKPDVFATGAASAPSDYSAPERRI